MQTIMQTCIPTFSILRRKQSIQSRGFWGSSVFLCNSTFSRIYSQTLSASAKMFLCGPGKHSTSFGNVLYTCHRVHIKYYILLDHYTLNIQRVSFTDIANCQSSDGPKPKKTRTTRISVYYLYFYSQVNTVSLGIYIYNKLIEEECL